jgi:hypothetical protein
MKNRRLDPIDSSTGSHQDEGNSQFIDPIDLAYDYLSDQLRLRQRQCSRSGSHHIRTTVDSLKLEYTPD